MKKLLIIVLLSPVLANAQVVVKKPITILTFGRLAWSNFLQRQIISGDTTYLFSFRNTSYKELVDIKTINLTKPQLRELGKSLIMVLASNISEEVWTNHISLSKQKVGFGSIGYQLYYDDGFCKLNEKDVHKIIDTIDRE